MEVRREQRRRRGLVAVLTLLQAGVVLCCAASADAGEAPQPKRDGEAVILDEPLARAGESHPLHEFDCGLQTREQWLPALKVARAKGQVPSAAEMARANPARSPEGSATGSVLTTCLSPNMIFPYEDTNALLTTNFSLGQLTSLMTEAANALISTHGDRFDFISFFLNYVPDHQIGSAFYLSIKNDVTGLGDFLFDEQAELGLIGDRVQGYVMLWRVQAWEPGTGPGSPFTRLVIAQEFEHRFAMYLPPLLDGRQMQGDNGACGRSSHWNWKVDGQSSGMEISEWAGSLPAIPESLDQDFNRDIPGGVFSYPDLYLMGYVSGPEMDAGVSELRFMFFSDCSSDYFGQSIAFDSSDIIAAAGPRVPDHLSSQKDFRTAWIMFHLPGDPPNAAELARATGILEQQTRDWTYGTLGRGAMNHALFDDCNCNGLADDADIGGGASLDEDGNGVPDECLAPCDDPVDTDGDGTGDLCDNCPVQSNASQNDYDRDGVGDRCDLCILRGDPGQTDRDVDGQGDACDTDDGRVHLLFPAVDTADWDAEGGLSTWNLYRGDLALLRSSGLYTQDPMTVVLANRQCGLTQPEATLAFDPPPGEAVFFLVAGVDDGAVELDLGTDSGGMNRPNDHACP